MGLILICVPRKSSWEEKAQAPHVAAAYSVNDKTSEWDFIRGMAVHKVSSMVHVDQTGDDLVVDWFQGILRMRSEGRTREGRNVFIGSRW